MSSFSLDVFSVCVGLKKKQCCKCLSLIFDAIFSITHTLIKESRRNFCRGSSFAHGFLLSLLSEQISRSCSAFSMFQKKQSAFTSAMPPQSAENVTAKAAASLAPARTKAYRSLVWPLAQRGSVGEGQFQSSGMSRHRHAVAPSTHPTICLLAGGGNKSRPADSKTKTILATCRMFTSCGNTFQE